MKNVHKRRRFCRLRSRKITPLLAFFIGTTLGLLLSPAKRGFNTGKITNYYYGKDGPAEHQSPEDPS